MPIEHKDIPDTDRHEPKGISSALDKLVYVSNGAGSGAWSSQFVNTAPYCEIDSAEQIVSLTSVTDIRLGSFVFDVYDASKFTLTTGNKLTVLENGIYYITWSFIFKPQTALGGSSEVLNTKLKVNGLPPVAEQLLPVTITRNSSIDDPFVIHQHRLISFAANDYIELFVNNAAATRSYKITSGMDLFKIRNL